MKKNKYGGILVDKGTKRQKDKNGLGEVFTPPELVKMMLDKLPKEKWSDPTYTVADSTGCGNGNILVEVIKRKIEAGLTPLKALSTVYGLDIMEDNIIECRERLLKQAEDSSGQKRTVLWKLVVLHNIVCCDALTFDINILGFGNLLFSKLSDNFKVVLSKKDMLRIHPNSRLTELLTPIVKEDVLKQLGEAGFLLW